MNDSLELAPPNPAVKFTLSESFAPRLEYGLTRVALTVGSVSLLDLVTKEDGVEDKERYACFPNILGHSGTERRFLL